MAEVLLHGFDVVPGADGIDSIGVAQIVDPNPRQPMLLTMRLKQS